MMCAENYVLKNHQACLVSFPFPPAAVGCQLGEPDQACPSLLPGDLQNFCTNYTDISNSKRGIYTQEQWTLQGMLRLNTFPIHESQQFNPMPSHLMDLLFAIFSSSILLLRTWKDLLCSQPSTLTHKISSYLSNNIPPMDNFHPTRYWSNIRER